jgi:hypothetical protein
VTGESESAILAVGMLSMLALLPRSRDPEGLKWDFPRGRDFAGCCARVELENSGPGSLNCARALIDAPIVRQKWGGASAWGERPTSPADVELRQHPQFQQTRVAFRRWLSVVCAPKA